MLFKTPKYTPPPQVASTDKALEEREARATAEEQKQIRSQAARLKALKRGGLMNEQNLDLLSGGSPIEEPTIKNPYGKYRSM